jgi:hypothetical protein
MLKDLGGGLALLVIAALYYHFGLDIQHSSLSDTVGADGFPKRLAFVLGALALVLVLKSSVRCVLAVRRNELRMSLDPEQSRAVLRMLGLAVLLTAFLWLLPKAGYPLSVGLLIVAVALYQRQPFSWRVLVAGAGGACMFWLLFVCLLGVLMPTGTWFGA